MNTAQFAQLEQSILAGEKARRGHGIQQPLVVVEHEGRMLLVKGTQRLSVARAHGIKVVPAVVVPLPRTYALDQFIGKLRFILIHHRQDLKPSQRAAVLARIRGMMGLTVKQLARAQGVNEDTLTHWLAPLKFVAPVVKALDAGVITLKGARVFDGLTEKGQEAIWKRHRKEIAAESGASIHRRLRAEYPPTTFPEYYSEPEKMAKRLAPAKARKAKRHNYSAGDAKRLMASVSTRQAEFESLQKEDRDRKKDIAAAAPVVSTILASKALLAFFPRSKAQLRRFAEVYPA